MAPTTRTAGVPRPKPSTASTAPSTRGSATRPPLGGPEAARQKHLARGKLLPRERVNGLLDPSPEEKFAERPEFGIDSLHRTAMIGTPEEIIPRLRAYEELGVDEYSFWIDNSMTYAQKRDSLERLINDVMPAFAASEPAVTTQGAGS